MADIIQLLPDSIANQIAAGEVVQRPASVVKELLENAIDAGGTKIKLIIKDAGKQLIQVIDNGCGMSETDARLCFERHATSKIKQAADLFAIRTMGFRGEAMASIAAIAQVELKTRQKNSSLGTRIVIAGSEIKIQEPCQCAVGTSIAVKNLFFNVPARRNFLKSRPVETRHIVDEFQRVALANPQVHFNLLNNTTPLFHLPTTNLRKRIVGLLGHNVNERLVPVEQEIDFLRIYGFIGKPEFARKTRGEQYFFVNERFIKSSYLNHAVINAYEDLIAPKTHPLYVLFIDIDPARIDVNVHPTKQEINFDNEQVVYNLVKATVRQALAVHNITPSINFDIDANSPFNQPPTFRKKAHKDLVTGLNLTTNPSTSKQSWSNTPASFKKPKVPKNWEDLYPTDDLPPLPKTTITIKSDFSKQKKLPLNTEDAATQEAVNRIPHQIHQRYILSHLKSGFILIDQQAAHERILFEQYVKAFDKQQPSKQQLLFPQTLELPPADAQLLKDILTDVNALGYDIQEFGQHTFVVHGIPSDVNTNVEEQTAIESLLEQYKQNVALKLDRRQTLARAMARNNALKVGKKLSIEEMITLVDQLFACEKPMLAPNGKPTFIKYKLDDIEKRFGR